MNRVVAVGFLFAACAASLLAEPAPRLGRTPQGLLDWPEPVTVQLTFAKMAAEKNRFLLDVLCEANVDVETVTVAVDHTEDVRLKDPETLAYTGPMKKGQRFHKRVVGAWKDTGDPIPPSINLSVEFPFPTDALLAEVRARGLAREDEAAGLDLLARLEARRGQFESVMKPLAVVPGALDPGGRP